MMVELIILLLFLGATFTCLLSGYPVAFGLGGAGVLVSGEGGGRRGGLRRPGGVARPW